MLPATRSHFRQGALLKVAEARQGRYSFAVSGMTRQEQLVVFAIIGLLLLGLAVKTWRTAHPPSPVVQKTH